MKQVYVVTLDEEFEKARKPGAKDRKPRYWSARNLYS